MTEVQNQNQNEWLEYEEESDSSGPEMELDPVWIEAQEQPQRMLRLFWTFATGFVLIAMTSLGDVSLTTLLTGGAIIYAGMLPGYLWCRGSIPGAPIFPLYGMTYTWAFGLPLLVGHPEVMLYEPGDHLRAAFLVVVHLIVGTLVWARTATRPVAMPRRLYVIPPSFAVPLLISILCLTALFSMGQLAAFFRRGGLPLPSTVVSILRAILYSSSFLGVFILSYEWGKRRLTNQQLALFLSFFGLFALSLVMSLFLIHATMLLAFACVGYVLGSHRIPWALVLIGFTMIGLLHYGKFEMRSKYWSSRQYLRVTPIEYPSRLQEWIGYSLTSFGESEEEGEDDTSPLLRPSLMHLLLELQDKTENGYTHLKGETYAVVPKLLVPRILYPNKPLSHEGNHIINVHYGRQAEEAVSSTTIPWGFLNEAFANFGMLGCLGVGAFFGLLYGWIARWALYAPLLSARSLFVLVFLNAAFQSEYSSGVFFSVTSQSMAPLVLLVLLFMKPVEITPETLGFEPEDWEGGAVQELPAEGGSSVPAGEAPANPVT